MVNSRPDFVKNSLGNLDHGFGFNFVWRIGGAWISELPCVVGKDICFDNEWHKGTVYHAARFAQFFQIVRPPEWLFVPRRKSLEALLSGLLAKEQRVGQVSGSY
jgi:hypothetical protein